MKNNFTYILSSIFSLIIIFCFLAVAIGSSLIRKSSDDLPSLEQAINYQPPLISKIFDISNETLLYQFGEQQREYVKYKKIPPKVINGFIAAEDKNFWSHSGYDPSAILKALVRNLQNVNDGKVIGGSTITQQVIKNTVLTNQRTIERKIKEAILSVQLEDEIPKEKILEIYLNDIYMGDGVYGISSASKHYFNKPLEYLSVHEIAFLAGLPKAPSRYSNNKDEALQRREYVLNQMMQNNFITDEEFNYFNSKQLPEKFESLDLNDNTNKGFIPYYISSLNNELNSISGLEDEGIRVVSFQDTKMQEYLENSLKSFLEKYMIENERWKPVKNSEENVKLHNWEIGTLIINNSDILIKTSNNNLLNIFEKHKKWIRSSIENLNNLKNKKSFFIENDGIAYIKQVPNIQGAMVAMNPKNGNVFAISGGYSNIFSEFNRAEAALRQPGSLLKPFIYATALELGWKPSSPILDSSISFKDTYSEETWRPNDHNESDRGFITLRSGLEYSRNSVTLRLFEDIGIERFRDTASKLNLYKDIPNELSIALGSKEVSLLNIASAYTALASNGIPKKPRFIKSIYKDNDVLWNQDNFEQKEPIYDEITLTQVRSMLKGVTEYGTAWRTFEDFPYDIYGKTGTTNEAKDTWFVGFSENILVGAYVGYDTPKPLGRGQTGGKTAAPIVKDFLSKIPRKYLMSNYRFPKDAEIIEINPDTGVPTPGGFPEIFRKN
jgi:penicillin-binding protein 1A